MAVGPKLCNSVPVYSKQTNIILLHSLNGCLKLLISIVRMSCIVIDC